MRIFARFVHHIAGAMVPQRHGVPDLTRTNREKNIKT